MLVLFGAADRSPLAAAGSPCATPTPGCTEWVTLRGGPARSMIYRTFPLDVRNDRIRRAMVMVHGTNRNADHYFTTATAAAPMNLAERDVVTMTPGVGMDP